MVFGSLSAAVLILWSVLMVSGAPPHWPVLLRYLPADFVPRFEPFRAVLAIVLIVGAGFLLRIIRRLPGRGLATWTVGLSLLWALLMTLLTPWLDYTKSYRALFAAMPLPEPRDCLASLGLGEGERAMLHYVTGRDPVRREVIPDSSCTYLLVQREASSGPPSIDRQQWREVWHGKRPGPAKERFWLFLSTKQ
jgi:hypothetical protein